MAPPHCGSIVYAGSGVGKHLTYLGYDEGMSILAVIEMSSVTYTRFVSGRGKQTGYAHCVPKPRALTMSSFSRVDTDW